MTTAERLRPRWLRREREIEPETRTNISSADRSRPVVRIWMGVGQIVVLVLLLVAGLGPLIWLALAAVSPTQDLIQGPFSFFSSGTVQWENLGIAWERGRIGHYLLNTAALALGSMVATLFISTTAAFVITVLRPRWGGLLSGAILATLFIPGIVSLVPLYLTVRDMPVLNISLVNTFWAVWLPAAATAFNVLIISRFLESIPAELYEAARIDGAGALRILWSIVLPLARPILGVVGLLTIVASWKDYLWPLLVLPNPDNQPVSVALPRLADQTELSVQMAALFLSLLVPVVLFLIFQRQFLRGASMSGGVKG
ncbi:carbohydrate ABC transporter permease [Humibacter sp. BT305]|uniref:ABC transporter permease n=1 Tax=Cnuibacter physcomitrellae TaxID=1619308 RepID=A0A1X9LGA5_9MICO|nr:carbohydrate ABC transporter permease [Cnuibacter physcomitrellae]ARJ04214.1 ABC transporter permease [Cnuibacter physcomitrellae]AXH34096.1 carbohydrate ABC transporter permease [Humibacter sp. BT305]MCS5497041.1 carbohydrate ABC transporter permease [Cnuibacter physcomitrellae]GGI40528.1 sugar ABC transporter permease [Cnuibacter physcomitrellae]